MGSRVTGFLVSERLRARFFWRAKYPDVLLVLSGAAIPDAGRVSRTGLRLRIRNDRDKGRGCWNSEHYGRIGLTRRFAGESWLAMNATTPETWMPEARQFAAQCWCDETTKDRVMDVELAESVARRIAVWMDTAAQAQRNVDYYRELLVRCGNAIGEPAHICDDGSRSDDVLCAKLPELIEAIVAGRRIFTLP